jgi:hypothetical protein
MNGPILYHLVSQDKVRRLSNRHKVFRGSPHRQMLRTQRSTNARSFG